MQFFEICPIHLIKSLSTALELAVNGVHRHHWQTAVIADHIARAAEVEELERRSIVYAALLHDIGAASNWQERRRIQEPAYRASQGVFKHAEAGFWLLREAPMLSEFAEAIRHHHDAWNGRNYSGTYGEQIPLAGRILHLADNIEVGIKDGQFILEQADDILASVCSESGKAFDPKLIDVFRNLGKAEYFWLDIVNPEYHERFFRELDVYGSVRYSLDDAIKIARIFSRIIDKMSRFTARHSQDVSQMAAFLAEGLGFSGDEVKAMRIAGLLHDLGKLAIPNEILEKAGPLDEREFRMIKQHTYYTYRILEQIDHFDVIAEWAAYHHETLDGCGYPFRIAGESLSLGSRIMAVADIFTALSEQRPYREPMEQRKVKRIMESMVDRNKIDGMVVKYLFDHHKEAIGVFGEQEPDGL